VSLPAKALGSLPLCLVTELFAQAEEKIKQVEKISRELPYPAVNELRYAGRHLLDYLASGEPGQLTQAENHCKRAIYDAVEAGVTFQLLKIQTFSDDFKMLPLKDHIEGYPALRVEINRAKALVIESKPEDQHKAEYYEACSRHLERLTEIHEQLEAYRDDLIAVLQRQNDDVVRRNEEALRQNEASIRDAKRHRTMVAIGISSILVACTGVLVTAWFSSPKDIAPTGITADLAKLKERSTPAKASSTPPASPAASTANR